MSGWVVGEWMYGRCAKCREVGRSTVDGKKERERRRARHDKRDSHHTNHTNHRTCSCYCPLIPSSRLPLRPLPLCPLSTHKRLSKPSTLTLPTNTHRAPSSRPARPWTAQRLELPRTTLRGAYSPSIARSVVQFFRTPSQLTP